METRHWWYGLPDEMRKLRNRTVRSTPTEKRDPRRSRNWLLHAVQGLRPQAPSEA